MRARTVAAIGALAAGVALTFMAACSGTKQTPSASDESAGAKKVVRTPWGDPDLQGNWNGKTRTPLVRLQRFVDKDFLTDADITAMEQERLARGTKETNRQRGTAADVSGAYNSVFSSEGESYVRTMRASLIVDPPDGKFPGHTPDGRARALTAQYGDGNPLVPGEPTVRGPVASPGDSEASADNPEDRNNMERCKSYLVPCINAHCQPARIVQSPSVVTIYHEAGHPGGGYRTIYLDGRSHPPPHIRQWYGHSIGHWESDTLVVDTANFSDRSNFFGSKENLHLIERYTRVEPDMLIYRVTIDDPTTFLRPWTVEIPWMQMDNQKNEIFETACHEGNYGLTGILEGARVMGQHAASK